MPLNRYSTLSQATNALDKQGFTAQFDFRNGKFCDLKSGDSYTAEQLVIVEYHRFEGMTNPADTSIVFAIETNDGTKGTLVMNYGASADLKVFDFMDKVPVRSAAR